MYSISFCTIRPHRVYTVGKPNLVDCQYNTIQYNTVKITIKFIWTKKGLILVLVLITYPLWCNILVMPWWQWLCDKDTSSNVFHLLLYDSSIRSLYCRKAKSCWLSIQYNTIQYNTTQYNTIQYNTITITIL